MEREKEEYRERVRIGQENEKLKDLAYKNVTSLINSVLQDANVITRAQLIVLRLSLLNARQAERLAHPTRNPVTDAKVPKLRVRKADARTVKKEPLQRGAHSTDSIKESL